MDTGLIVDRAEFGYEYRAFNKDGNIIAYKYTYGCSTTGSVMLEIKYVLAVISSNMPRYIYRNSYCSGYKIFIATKYHI